MNERCKRDSIHEAQAPELRTYLLECMAAFQAQRINSGIGTPTLQNDKG